ncbi:uncharacterized protein LOC141630628 [Silene latifolia]|uniref:uncharacterized protein LOC141630628 n=1 Tax=Silene latifolia TaxID=37657 RepID=UPI003D77E136
MSEVVGITTLNLESLVDEPVVEEVTNTSILVVLDTIEEEPEELLQFTEAEVDKISFLSNGVFLVRFKSMAARTAVLKLGHFLFDNKPLIFKPWTPEIELVKHAVQSVPVWVKLHKLPLKFWGKGIARISGLLGKFVKCDPATEDKVRIGYARVIMIDIEFGKPLNDKVKFLDEHGNVVYIDVEYEWKPVVCSVCKGIGQDTSDCRKAKKEPAPIVPSKKIITKVWKPKIVDKGKGPLVTTPDEVIQSTPQVEIQLKTPVVWHKNSNYTSSPSHARPIMRMSRQEVTDGAYSVHKFGQHSFLEALIKSNTPKVGIGISGNVSHLWWGMYNFGFWNIRGLNKPTKQTHIKWFMHMNKVGLFGLLETKVKTLALNSLQNLLMDGWSLSTNNNTHKGGKVWILWNPAIFHVDFIDYSAQCIYIKAREDLWAQLADLSARIIDTWLVCGDFNCVLSHAERLGGSCSDNEIDDFQRCLTRCGLVDSPTRGSFFTWNNKHDINTIVYSILDRALIN